MGININSAFPSNYIKAADLQGRNVRCKIDRVLMEEVGSDRKPVMYFSGKEKGLVLNRTNAAVIADTYGEDTDDWVGGEVELFSAKVLFQNKMVDAIRLSVPKNAAKPTPKPKEETAGVKDYDDDIPF